MIEQEIIQRLRSANTAAGSDVRPEFRVENTGTSPGIVVQRTQEEQTRTLDGTPLATRGAFNIDCYGSDYQTVKQLAEEVKASLDGFQGLLVPAALYRVWSSRLVGNQDLTEVDGQKVIRHVSQTFVLTYVEI